MPRWLSPIRLVIALVVVAGAVVAYVGWQRSRDVDELQRRFDCPADVEAAEPPGAEEPSAAQHVVQLTEIAQTDSPVALASRQGDGGLYVAQREGGVVRIDPASGAETPVVDISDEVSLSGEQGLLGMTFSADGTHLYLDFTDLDGHTNVIEYETTDTGVDGNSRRLVLFVEQPHRWHNAGHLAFGPDGMLYVSLGDGGGQADPWDNGQDVSTLLSSILRIDPRPSGDAAYQVPEDNPFVGVDDARPELWAYGFRNPWRFSFDRETGDLWISDAGEACFEEIDVQRAGDSGGNFGWDLVEGPWVVDPPAPENAVFPVYAYRRNPPACAIVGGFVYRGEAIPDLRGTYLFGDFCGGQVMGLRQDGDDYEAMDLGRRAPGLVSFAEGVDGEPFVLSLNGEIYRLEPVQSGER